MTQSDDFENLSRREREVMYIVHRLGEVTAESLQNEVGEGFSYSGLLGGCFLREAPEGAIGSDRRAGKWGLMAAKETNASRKAGKRPGKNGGRAGFWAFMKMIR